MDESMKTVLITGAAGNLGRTVVSSFLEKNYQVIATVLNGEETQLLPDHKHLRVQELNLLDEDAVEQFVAEIISGYKSIECALMLAGGFAMGNIAKTDKEALRKQMALNFETAFSIVRPLFIHMKEKGYGRLVFIGTRPALKAEAGKDMIAYSLSKSLLFRFSEMLNADAQGSNVVSTVMVPSTIDTPDNRKAMPKADFSSWVQPEELAGLMHVVCSDTGNALRETVLKVYNNS